MSSCLAQSLVVLLSVSSILLQHSHVVAQVTSAERQAFLDGHNNVRRMVDPRACPPLPPLVWHDALAELAQNYSEKCTFTHNSQRVMAVKGIFSSVGENLYQGPRLHWTMNAAVVSVRNITETWAMERKFYNHTANTCNASAICAHYTQIVWNNTTHIGCGITNCTSPSDHYIVVCNYGEAGNFTGQSPYQTGGCPLPTTQTLPPAITNRSGEQDDHSTGVRLHSITSTLVTVLFASLLSSVIV